MNGDGYIERWIQALEAATKRFRLVFVQLGAVHFPVRRQLSTLAESATSTVLGVEDYLEGGVPAGVTRVHIWDLERAGVVPGSSSSLSVLRSRIVSDMDSGIDFVLFSRAPRISFAPVPGSSLLEDATFLRPPLVRSTPEPGEEPEIVLPSFAADGTPIADTFLEVLQELGVEVCASLDQAIFESMLTGNEVFGVLAPREVEALEGSGLVLTQHGQWQWSVPQRLNILRDALSDALADVSAAQHTTAEVYQSLWTLERTVRRHVRAQAISVWGTRWRGPVLHGDLAVKVLERATVAAYVAAKSTKELRDPLEWLTLGELLELRKRKEIGDLGLDGRLWSLLEGDILPIRNRVSHMRLVKSDDLAKVRQWQRALDRKITIAR